MGDTEEGSVGPKILEAPEKIARMSIISEILNTEQAYVLDLDEVALRYQAKVRGDKILSSEDEESLFGPWGQIRGVHSKLVGQLKQRLGVESLAPVRASGGGAARGSVVMEATIRTASYKIGDIFLEFSGSFGVYDKYCAGYAQSVGLIERLRTSNVRFQALCRSNEEELGHSLRDSLIKPIQRICKYPLLFGSLLKCMQPNNSDYEVIANCRSRMEEIATHINIRREDAENISALMRIERGVSGLKNRIAVPARRFLYEGDLMKVSPHKADKLQLRHFFLFNDHMMYTSKTRKIFKLGGGAAFAFKGSIPLDRSVVREVPDTSSHRFGFQVIRMDTKRIFTFYANSIQDRLTWVQKLNLAIDAFLKRRVRRKKSRESANRATSGAPENSDSKKSERTRHSTTLATKLPDRDSSSSSSEIRADRRDAKKKPSSRATMAVPLSSSSSVVHYSSKSSATTAAAAAEPPVPSMEPRVAASKKSDQPDRESAVEKPDKESRLSPTSHSSSSNEAASLEDGSANLRSLVGILSQQVLVETRRREAAEAELLEVRQELDLLRAQIQGMKNPESLPAAPNSSTGQGGNAPTLSEASASGAALISSAAASATIAQPSAAEKRARLESAKQLLSNSMRKPSNPSASAALIQRVGVEEEATRMVRAIPRGEDEDTDSSDDSSESSESSDDSDEEDDTSHEGSSPQQPGGSSDLVSPEDETDVQLRKFYRKSRRLPRLTLSEGVAGQAESAVEVNLLEYLRAADTSLRDGEGLVANMDRDLLLQFFSE